MDMMKRDKVLGALLDWKKVLEQAKQGMVLPSERSSMGKNMPTPQSIILGSGLTVT